MPRPVVGDSEAGRKMVVFYRHSLPVRLSHWLNALCVFFLLLSGLQIFNAHPYLYWGHSGADMGADRPVLAIEAVREGDSVKGVTSIGSLSFDTTGVLGVSEYNGRQVFNAFPSWSTLPAHRDLSSGRRVHFFFAWVFVINGFAYWLYGIAGRHFRRDLMPSWKELSPLHLLREIIDHARLRFPHGEEARRYNTLQKLTYLVMIALVLPLVVLTGLSMSPGFDAICPWLPDPFGGRQSARTLHFIAVLLIVIFIGVHVGAVLASGVVNNLRSMITGYYALTLKMKKESGHER